MCVWPVEADSVWPLDGQCPGQHSPRQEAHRQDHRDHLRLLPRATDWWGRATTDYQGVLLSSSSANIPVFVQCFTKLWILLSFKLLFLVCLRHFDIKSLVSFIDFLLNKNTTLCGKSCSCCTTLKLKCVILAYESHMEIIAEVPFQFLHMLLKWWILKMYFDI